MLEKYLILFSKYGYFLIFILMAIESSFIPFPSEVVLPPAGYLASKGKLDLLLSVFSGVMGSLAGAYVNYFLALKLGRNLVYQFVEKKGKWFLLKKEHLEKVEKFWDKYGHISTFSGRLIPGIRQLISIPAGFARMPLLPFTIYTALGAFIWCLFLALCGYFFGQNEALLKEILKKGYTALAFLGLFVFLLYYFYKNRKI